MEQVYALTLKRASRDLQGRAADFWVTVIVTGELELESTLCLIPYD